MSKNTIDEINNLSRDELEIIIKQKSYLFSEDEIKVAKARYDSLNKDSNSNSFTLPSDTSNLSSQLLRYNIGGGAIDDLTNTRILLRIFKCVNFIKNVLIAGLVCGGIGIVLAVMK